MDYNGIAKGIRNAFIVAGTITFIYIIFQFISGNYIGERLEGTWRAACIQDEITFEGSSFTRGWKYGEFWLRANLIYFCVNGNGYPLRITARYMVLDGIYYFRVEE